MNRARAFLHRPGGAVAAAAAFGLALASLGLLAPGYGFALFVVAPLLIGLVAAELYRGRRSRSWPYLLALSQAALLGSGGLLLLSGTEGLICLLMALPLGSPMAALGATLTYFRRRARMSHPGITVGALAAFPLLLAVETALPPEPPVYAVATSIEIDAPPERVWPAVLSFPELPPPTELLFRLGVAYPIRAEIRGTGVGAIRYCIFSTGSFIEPIEAWEAPRLLRFSVSSSPPPMKEWTPYTNVQPPHLDSFLAARQGQFELQPLPGGRTRLVGATWYSHGLWPASYWKLWADAIIHRVHLRVLRHIQLQVEAPVPSASRPPPCIPPALC